MHRYAQSRLFSREFQSLESSWAVPIISEGQSQTERFRALCRPASNIRIGCRARQVWRDLYNFHISWAGDELISLLFPEAPRNRGDGDIDVPYRIIYWPSLGWRDEVRESPGFIEVSQIRQCRLHGAKTLGYVASTCWGSGIWSL